MLVLAAGRDSRDSAGRKFIGFMSGNQQDPDMICEIFVLASNDIAH
jgi:hypothetical protein